jgi:hypothetical protein
MLCQIELPPLPGCVGGGVGEGLIECYLGGGGSPEQAHGLSHSGLRCGTGFAITRSRCALMTSNTLASATDTHDAAGLDKGQHRACACHDYTTIYGLRQHGHSDIASPYTEVAVAHDACNKI